MTEENLEVLLVVAGAIAGIVVLMIIWFVLKSLRTRGRALTMALDGVGHEFRFNLQRVLSELRDLTGNGDAREELSVPLGRPQLDSLLTQPAVKDKRALERLDTTYQALEASRQEVRSQGQTADSIEAYKRSAVDAIAILYLWEQHKGGLPEKAPSTSASSVRDWLKSLGFSQTLIPGMALRDEVIKHLRRLRMPLKPSDLGMSAQDYYALPVKDSRRPEGELVAGVPAATAPVVMADEVETAEAETPRADEPVAGETQAEEVQEEAVAEVAVEAPPEPETVEDAPQPERSVVPATADPAQPSRRRRRRR